MLNAKMVQVFA